MKSSLSSSLVVVTAIAFGPDSQAFSEAPAAPQPPSSLSGSVDLPGAVQVATGFSADKQAVTVIFRNLMASVEGNSHDLTRTRVQTVTVPLTAGSPKTHVTQDIRGFVAVNGKATASLIVVSGGIPMVVDLKASRDEPKTQHPASSSFDAAVKSFQALAPPTYPVGSPKRSPQPPEGESYNFNTRIATDVPAGSTHRVTFILLAESDQNNEDALLSVDSLDVAIVNPTPSPPTK
jgi:hypothetical protein